MLVFSRYRLKKVIKSYRIMGELIHKKYIKKEYKPKVYI